ncbi:MAG: cytidine deaminase [Thalassolituus oleivorans]|jgi:cytidine deaminase
MTSEQILDRVRATALAFLPNAHTPYSGRPASAAVLLSDGLMVPGVRVESASFSLSIPAGLNAVTTAIAASRRDVVALVYQGPAPLTTDGYAQGLKLVAGRVPACWVHDGQLPTPTQVLDPFEAGPGSDPAGATAWAKLVSERALIPESHFPVGTILQTHDGRFLPGVNVEHPDWTCILCAERNVLGTAVTFGALPVRSIGLGCPTAPGASPCGACRQLIAELAPDAVVWIDRGTSSPEAMTPGLLLPHAFYGDALPDAPSEGAVDLPDLPPV